MISRIISVALVGCVLPSLVNAAALDIDRLSKSANANLVKAIVRVVPATEKPATPPPPSFGPLPYRLSTLRGITFEATQLPFVLELAGTDAEDFRILGGVAAGPSDFPWQVALLNSSYGTLFCGGSHLGGGWILSAAHCFFDEFGQALKRPHVVVLTGSTDLLSGGRRVALMQDPVVHEQWNATTKANDIALVRIQMTQSLVSAQIPSPATEAPLVSDGQRLQVSGWGTTTENGTISTKLLKVSVPVAPKDKCVEAYPGKISDRQICAGTKGLDSCQGDSGGPLTAGPGALLVGVVSFGRGCGRDGFPGVYTHINSYRSWIKSKTGI